MGIDDTTLSTEGEKTEVKKESEKKSNFKVSLGWYLTKSQSCPTAKRASLF